MDGVSKGKDSSIFMIQQLKYSSLVAHLGSALPSTRKRLCQYVSFFRKLRKSTCKEVRVLSEIVARDVRSPTGHNLKQIEKEFECSAWTISGHMLSTMYKETEVPEMDLWRLPLLDQLLAQRQEMEVCGEEVVELTALIDSLCSS